MVSKILLCVVLYGMVLEIVSNETPVEELVEELFYNYNKDVRPGLSLGAVHVNHRLQLNRIFKVDENSIEGEFWQTLQWQDKRLSWDPEDYRAGSAVVRRIVVPRSKVWTPDVTPYQYVAELEDKTKNRVVVSHNGNVFSVPVLKLTSYCRAARSADVDDVIRERDFICSLRFGSWVYAQDGIDLDNSFPRVDTSELIPHAEYAVVKTSGERQVRHYECCPESYVSLVYTIVLRNRIYMTDETPELQMDAAQAQESQTEHKGDTNKNDQDVKDNDDDDDDDEDDDLEDVEAAGNEEESNAPEAEVDAETPTTESDENEETNPTDDDTDDETDPDHSMEPEPQHDNHGSEVVSPGNPQGNPEDLGDVGTVQSHDSVSSAANINHDNDHEQPADEPADDSKEVTDDDDAANDEAPEESTKEKKKLSLFDILFT